MANLSLNRISVALIAVILTFTSLKYAQNIFAPMMLAFVLGIILSPVCDFWDRLGAPRAASAFATLIIGLGAVLTVGFLLEPSVTMAINQAPVIWSELSFAVSEVKTMLRGLDEISENVAEAIDPQAANAASSSTSVSIPSAAEAAVMAPQYLAQVMVLIGTLYFFLLARTDIYTFFGKTFPKLAEADLFLAEKQVARYFLTVSMINACFGVIVGATMTVLGMPSPVFWGILAFLVNFILYLGPATLAVALLLTGIITFDGPYSFLPAALYLAMNATEGQFVTPSLVGKSMSVNPLLVFLSLVFWLWLWGPLGGFIAIPFLIWALAVSKPIRAAATSSPHISPELQSSNP